YDRGWRCRNFLLTQTQANGDITMIATRISCPHCRTVLQSAQAVAPGRTVKCLKCGQPFTVMASKVGVTAESPPKPNLVFSDLSPSVGPPRTRPAGNGRGFVVAGIVTVFLVGAAGGAIYYLSQKDSAPSEPQTSGAPEDDSDTINVKRGSGS